MVRTADQAATLAEQAAARGDTHTTGRCLEVTRGWYAIPALFQDGWDHDGSNEAMDAWTGCQLKHPGDQDPPRGVPCFFSGGSSGHVAITTGRGTQVVSSDWPKLSTTIGRIGLTTIEQIERSWGRTYVGWSGDLNGVTIPGLTLVSHPASTTPNVPQAPGAPSWTTPQEDDMNLSDQLQVARADGHTDTLTVGQVLAALPTYLDQLQAAVGAVPAQTMTAVRGNDGRNILDGIIQRGYDIAALSGKVDGLTAALAQVKAGGGVIDLTAVTAAAEAGAKAALANLTLKAQA